MEFKGRAADLELLARQLATIAAGRASDRGRALIVTGRRRVGKSRLVQEFCDRSQVPYAIFQATRGRNPAAERADFAATLAQSCLPGSELVAGIQALDWNQALRTLAVALPDDTPSVAVIDEVPWLVEQDSEFEGALQTTWDRYLLGKPVLLILVGSDVSMMEALQTYGRPFFGRAATMTVNPLHLADVRDMTGLAAADAVDALLITGGFPEIVQSWEPGQTPMEFRRASVADPLSPLLAAGELTLLGEFPEATLSRAVLEAIGSGERTYSAIATAAGAGTALPAGTLSPILNTLQDKRVVVADTPLSVKPANRDKRYRIADVYLRFWLALLGHALPLIERGRADLALTRIERSWPSWRGRAVEPLIRDSLLRLLPESPWPEAGAVGGWWNRQNNPEIDLIGADRSPIAGQVFFTGSIKWLEKQPFGNREFADLVRDVAAVPGVTSETPLVVVSRSGTREDLPVAASWGPDDLMRAWRDVRQP